MSDYNTVIINLLLGLYRNLDKNLAEKIDYAGGNTGNIVFTEAMKEYLDFKAEIWLNSRDLNRIKNPSVIIPSANFIRVGEEILFLAIIRFLEQTDCPVTMAGLGAQATLEEKPKDLVKKLSSIQVKALKMIAERAHTLGVRGEFTAECLSLLGVNNIRVIGCPSFYFRHVSRPHAIDTKNTQVTFSSVQKEKKFLLKKAIEWDSFWVAQTMVELPQLAQIDNLDSEHILLISNAFECSNKDAEIIWRYIKKRSKIFFNYSDWKNFYVREKIGFAFGSRFHGNMAAFRNGIPALWFTHDMRTEELIKALHLPSICLKDIEKISSLEDLAEQCDYEDCLKYDKTLHQQFINFLNENHLSLKDEFSYCGPAWSRFEYFEDRWEARVKFLASYLKDSDIKIMDLGCGQGKLSNYLSVNQEYIPVDYKDRGNNNIICDFNKYEFPNVMADVSFVSGVMEYVNDWQWFIERMCKCSRTVIVSYCSVETYGNPNVRRRVHWVNNLSIQEIIDEFKRNGFSMSLNLTFLEKTAIMKFCKDV